MCQLFSHYFSSIFFSYMKQKSLNLLCKYIIYLILSKSLFYFPLFQIGTKIFKSLIQIYTYVNLVTIKTLIYYPIKLFMKCLFYIKSYCCFLYLIPPHFFGLKQKFLSLMCKSNVSINLWVLDLVGNQDLQIFYINILYSSILS